MLSTQSKQNFYATSGSLGGSGTDSMIRTDVLSQAMGIYRKLASSCRSTGMKWKLLVFYRGIDEEKEEIIAKTVQRPPAEVEYDPVEGQRVMVFRFLTKRGAVSARARLQGLKLKDGGFGIGYVQSEVWEG